MKFRLIAILAASCFLANYSSAQMDSSSAAAANSPEPTPPYVAPIPQNAQWTVTLQYGTAADKGDRSSPTKADGKAVHQLQQIQCTKTGAIKHDKSIYSDGIVEESWYSDSVLLAPFPNSKQIMVITNLQDLGRINFGEKGNPTQSFGFTGVDWVKKSYFEKMTSFQKKNCYHYILPGNEQTSGAEAWIDVKTALPVAYKVDGVIYTYQFDSPPSSSLSVPPPFSDELQAYNKNKQREKSLEEDLKKKQ